jgi:DNA-directed RNA polymerase specialized sigma24 family protein
MMLERSILMQPERPENAGSLDRAISVFVRVRPRLFGIAYRMLGSAADAEDIVQNVWLRWQTTDRSVVSDAPAFLATATARLAINLAQSARSRRREMWRAGDSQGSCVRAVLPLRHGPRVNCFLEPSSLSTPHRPIGHQPPARAASDRPPQDFTCHPACHCAERIWLIVAFGENGRHRPAA